MPVVARPREGSGRSVAPVGLWPAILEVTRWGRGLRGSGSLRAWAEELMGSHPKALFQQALGTCRSQDDGHQQPEQQEQQAGQQEGHTARRSGSLAAAVRGCRPGTGRAGFESLSLGHPSPTTLSCQAFVVPPRVTPGNGYLARGLGRCS